MEKRRRRRRRRRRSEERGGRREEGSIGIESEASRRALHGPSALERTALGLRRAPWASRGPSSQKQNCVRASLPADPLGTAVGRGSREPATPVEHGRQRVVDATTMDTLTVLSSN
ncbi:unnamed protein product [Prorocentrum cordatum]|uniref:Uncharacterized protein n=1 Tax=Prorocentrum cordatum TaxID=2364126 RepID=A0ABN9R8S6_9DINO|nr:unnamed protein product [Polarella glacialis]